MKDNTIGRLTCPICGEPAQDFRVNKNGNLYMYCDNHCAIKFNPKMSKKYYPELMAGHSIQIEKIGVITSTKEKKENGIQWKQPRTDSGANRANIDRRTDGAVAGAEQSRGKLLGGFLSGFLADDDE